MPLVAAVASVCLAKKTTDALGETLSTKREIHRDRSGDGLFLGRFLKAR
jgi:hypothetical protein